MDIKACCTAHPDKQDHYLLFLELCASPAAVQERKPVHLALAIDASSSMGGPRLTCAVQAARSLANRLDQGDVFCLLSFSREVRILFGPGQVDDHAKQTIGEALAQLKPGVGTAMYSALEQAHECLRRVFVRGAQPHVIMLTDGFPSIGPNQPETFTRLTQLAAEGGIVTSAVGVGIDFDERSVAAIASGGGGRYSFVDHGSDIDGAFARHLSDLFKVAIENVTVRVAPASMVREATLLHRYPTKVGLDGFVVETGPIGYGNPRRLLMQLSCTKAPAPTAATVGISVHSNEASEESNRILSVSLDPHHPLVDEALRELRRLELSGREHSFWDAVRRNQRSEAAQAHLATEDALAALIKCTIPAQEIEADQLRLQDQQAVLDGRLSDEAREAARKRSHQTSISRITSVSD